MPTAPPNDARHIRMRDRVRCRTINLIQDLRLDIPSMKHQIEKPSEQAMRFFTPELYIQFNSSDDEEADCASAAWETAIEEYRRHLESIRPKLPSQVKKVADLCLHDAELLGFEQAVQSGFPFLETPWPVPFWYAVASLSLRQDQSILSLIYMLWDQIREYPAMEDWPFSKLRTHWLYDELDLVSDHRGLFLHRILFSDGRVIEVPFISVFMNSFLLPVAEEGSVSNSWASQDDIQNIPKAKKRKITFSGE